MSNLFVLFEHAAGYALFSIKEFEEIGMLLPQVESSVTDLRRFNAIVNLASFAPFKNRNNALENINSVSEGILSDDLQIFLERNLPKKEKPTLGVYDTKLAAAITDAIGCQCLCTGPIPEIIRGIRFHFSKLVKGFTSSSSDVAQRGLGHFYSTAKVKFNVHREDNMVIQSISLLDQLDKDINTFSMKLREWYSFHFPELYKIIPDNYIFAKASKLIGNRTLLSEEKLDELEEVVQDRSKAEAILDASRSSMGMDISEIDLINIKMFASIIIRQLEYRRTLSEEYLHGKMTSIAPNTAALLGDHVGARLISHAGSLTNLAKLPASTVQILGAEKALFRALKTRSNMTPKYGLLFHSPFIARAEAKNKGRISRFLANKCSIASRIDAFIETPNSIFGEKLKQQVEDRLNFYISGTIPPKNLEVMKEAISEVAVLEATQKKKKKKKKKDKKNQLENGDIDKDETLEGKLQKKKRKSDNDEMENSMINASEEKPKKKKKKSGIENDLEDETVVNGEGGDAEEPKKKKKKSKRQSEANDE